MQLPAYQTDQFAESLTILQRIARADKTAVEECLDKHGNLVWTLAKKFTDSTEDAENAAQEIFLDLWKYADRFDGAKSSEDKFIFFVALRCLIKRRPELASEMAVLIGEKVSSAQIAGFGEKLKAEYQGTK